MSSRPIISFLYLHGIHHLYHTAMTAIELSNQQNEYQIIMVSCSEEHTKLLKKIQKIYPKHRTRIKEIPLPFRFKYLNIKNKSYPSPISTMPKIAKFLQETDAIVATSHSTITSAEKYKITQPKFIYQYHGCGDRKYGFEPNLGLYDLMLLPGKYHQNRLINSGVISKEKTAIIGWPKLDYPTDVQGLRKKLFPNDRHIVLYTPHWDPKISSFRDCTRSILKYFKNNKEVNLLFAPHIQLKHWKIKYKYDLNFEPFQSSNIYIDLGSEESVNSSYLRISDIYMGDVSSQVYEWIAIKPRPCIFLNAHKVQWKDDINYRHWKYGFVVEDISKLGSVFEHVTDLNSAIDYQKSQITEYIDLSTKKYSIRAAEAIYHFLES